MRRTVWVGVLVGVWIEVCRGVGEGRRTQMMASTVSVSRSRVSKVIMSGVPAVVWRPARAAAAAAAGESPLPPKTTR